MAVFAFTLLLLDSLTQSAPSRIINVSSMAHSSSLNFDNLAEPRHFDGWHVYRQSKLCNILFTYALAEKLQNLGVTVNCLPMRMVVWASVPAHNTLRLPFAISMATTFSI